MTKIDQIAQAFAQGVKFAENLKLAMDAAKDGEENGHWVTIGEGEEARPVFIKDKKAKSKKAESKKAESKSKDKAKKSETSSVGALTEKGSALAQLAEREYDKVITALKDDIGSIESDPTFPPTAKRYEIVPIKSRLRGIKHGLSDVHTYLSVIKDEVSKAVKEGNFNRRGVESVWKAMKQLKDRTSSVVSQTDSVTAWLSRNNERGMKGSAEAIDRLYGKTQGIREDAYNLIDSVRGSIAQYEQENTSNK